MITYPSLSQASLNATDKPQSVSSAIIFHFFVNFMTEFTKISNFEVRLRVATELMEKFSGFHLLGTAIHKENVFRVPHFYA